MPPEPVPAEPGWDDDPAWTRPDPMTAAELEAALDRVCEQDEGYCQEEHEDFEPFTPEELAEIREAAADELLAVEAATTGRRGPGQPGSARVFPGQSSSPAAGFGPGMPLDVLPGCADLAVAADAAAGRGRRLRRRLGGRAGRGGVRVGPGRGPRRRPQARRHRRSWPAATPPPKTPSSPPTRSRTRWASPAAAPGTLIDLAQTLETRLPGTAAALDDGTIYPVQGRDHRPRHRPARRRPRPAPPSRRSWTGPPG